MAQKLATPYHLLLEREQLLTSGFECPLALIESRGTAEVREAQAAIVGRLEHVTPDLVRARPIWIGGEMDRPGRSSPDPCTDQFDLYLDRSMVQNRAGPIQTSADPDWQARRSGSG